MEKLPKIRAVFIHLSTMEAVKSQKRRAGSPTVVSYIHRLSNLPPPPPPVLTHWDGDIKGPSGCPSGLVELG